MKLSEYIKQLTQIVEEKPEYADLTVIYAKDDEGNEFSKIGFAPSLGNLNAEKEFTQIENFEDIDEEDRIVNSICIN